MSEAATQIAAAPAATTVAAAPATATASTQNLAASQNSQNDAGGQGAAAAQAAQNNGAKPAEGAPQGAPEAYQPFTMPEGMKLDEQSFKDFSVLAKNLNMTQENAQSVAAIGAGLVQRALQSVESAKAEQIKGWHEQSVSDKEFGGDKLKTSLGVANKFLETFGSKELTAVLESTGLGSHPALIRALVKAGSKLMPDGILTGSSSTGLSSEEAGLRAMYPSMYQKT